MPGRLRQTAARTSVHVEEEGPYNIPGLRFNEPLSWRAGKTIPVSDLFSRLEALSKELRDIQQDAIEASHFKKLAADLASPNLIGHKDKGIRAWATACIVSILAVCAPNAPYDMVQLKDIFTVIVSTIIPALADPGNTYNEQHVFILDSLVDASSIVLIGDVHDNEKLITSLFQTSFDIVSGSTKNTSGIELSKSVEFQLGRLLVTVIDECSIPQDVVDLVVAQFLRVDPRSVQEQSGKKKHGEPKDKNQSTLQMIRDYPPAYNMAKSLCAACPDKMATAIGQKFSTIITNASLVLTHEDESSKHARRASSSDDEDEQNDEEAIADLKKVHRLVRELWRACPDVLVNVIPQLEIELAADAVLLRDIAVETLGDLVAGIGLAGMPDHSLLNPATFPLPTISESEPTTTANPLLAPSAPKPFIHLHSSTYQAFFGRRVDRSPQVRVTWAKVASRILLTNAGGVGLNPDEQNALLAAYAQVLKDTDEKVRLAALQHLEPFSYHKIVNVLAADGGLSQAASILHAISERAMDKKQHVREAAMRFLGRAWGVASRDISNGDDRVRSVLASAPSKLLSVIYANDVQVNTILDEVLHESLLPWSFPPFKTSEKNVTTNTGEPSQNPDVIRTRRMLVLIQDLDDRSRRVFFALQKRQADLAKLMSQFLKACEDYNGGVVEDSSDRKAEDQLKRLIDVFSKQLPDTARASNDLWKFVKSHDRRNYQLIRFAIGAEYDFKTVTKAMKELTKRVRENASSALLETLTQLLYKCALLCYNRSHVPVIMDFARSAESGVADIAQEVLGEISARVPEVLKSHIQVLCKELEDGAPSEKQEENVGAADTLKTCATFAKRYPADVPKDRKFLVALTHYVQFAKSPKAAKHATSIILSISEKKDYYAKEIISKALKRYRSSPRNQLAQLAAIAQVCLLGPVTNGVVEDEILQIAVKDILHQNRRSEPQPNDVGEDDAQERRHKRLAVWSNEMDDETESKILAIRILVNRCRFADDRDTDNFDPLARSVLDVLMSIINNDGEISPSQDTPPDVRNHVRLAALRGVLKLCQHKPRCEALVTPQNFERIAYTLSYPPFAVRRGLVEQLKKYLSTSKLHHRWLTILFLLVVEPDTPLRTSTLAWLKSRNLAMIRAQKQVRVVNGDKKTQTSSSNIMELLLARLISLLAHHPDYPDPQQPDYEAEMFDMAKYIIYYLQAVATEDNLSLIFHVSQRLKQAQDALHPDSDEMHQRLYVLSDLAQATIRNYADQMPTRGRGINILQTYPGRAGLPTSLFQAIPGHGKAQEIAERNFLPDEIAEGLEQLVRRTLRSKQKESSAKSRSTPKSSKVTPGTKRRRGDALVLDSSDDEGDRGESTKRSRKTVTPSYGRTPLSKKRKQREPMSVEQPSRKSARTSHGKSINYIESDEDEEEEEEEDAEDIVAYRPAPMSKRSSKRRPDTPELAGGDPEEHERGSVDDQEPPTSPAARRGRSHRDGQREPEATEDLGAQVTSDHEQGEDVHVDTASGSEDGGEAEDVQEDTEHEAEPEEDEQEPMPLQENRNHRNTRGKPGTTPVKVVRQSKSTKPPRTSSKTTTTTTKNTNTRMGVKHGGGGGKASDLSRAQSDGTATRRSTRRANV